ncbi:MAG: hypothetical protein DWQ02_01060 [Bacteroidetes bacterium]|nr:MAG: hypothetical protein DWQ02_01060 [Bacteroidota bacterium]
MWKELTFYSLILCLLGLAFQDFKSRKIDLWLLIVMGFLVLICAGLNNDLKTTLTQTGINLGFLAIQLLLVSLYFSMKAGGFVNIADKYLGWGDIVFLVLITPLFSPLNFLYYYSAALFITLTFSFIYFMISPKPDKKIPLISGLSLTLVLVLVLSKFLSYNLYTDFLF